MRLRDYQEKAIAAVRQEISQGRRAVLLVIATGGGKTVTSSSIIRSAVAKGKRCIFLAHRKELISQCSRTLSSLGVDHGVIKSGSKKANLKKPVQVASVQTLVRRDHWPADLVIIDEAHRSMASTYQKIAERYREENSVILGLTATPYRMDGKPLGEMYDSMVEVISTQELVDEDFLVAPKVFGSKNPPDLSAVEVGSQGDYKRDQLGEAMSSTVLHGELLSNWTRICGDALGSETLWANGPGERKKVVETKCDATTVIFAPNVKTSLEIVSQFEAAGVKAAHVDGNTDASVRAKILEDLSSGALSVVSNVDILTEGWDLPHLECVIGARPTRSKSLYKQMGGRLMRPDDKKRIAVLLDHANWTRTHGFLEEPTVHSLAIPEARPRKGEGGPPVKQCPECESLQPLGTKECGSCGYAWPARGGVEVREESLVELDAKKVKRAQLVPQSERQQAFAKLATRCVERKYKPNWARVQYMKIYGEWPSAKSGISMPRFFMSYEREKKKALLEKIMSEAAISSDKKRQGGGVG